MSRVPSKSPIPHNLRKARQAAGLTQSQVAEAADVTDATISRIERGRFLPSQDLLGRLASAVGVTEAELLNRRRAPKRRELRPSEARLLAVVRDLEEPAIDDLTRGLKLILSVGYTSALQ